MTKSQNSEFDLIIKDIENNNTFRELRKEYHHGISRYDHSYRVAKGVYKLTKFLKLNYVEATRAALLHDFYFDNQMNNENKMKKLMTHPPIATNNASNNFELNDMQKNMIESHMFPVCRVMPKHKESICLTLVDKYIAIYEQTRFEANIKLGIYILFIFNMITLQK